MSTCSKTKLRKIKREKRLEKILSRQLTREAKILSGYRQVCGTFSSNALDRVTKIRILAYTPAHNPHYYVITVLENFSYEIFNHDEEYKPVIFVLALPSVSSSTTCAVMTDEEAQKWAASNMRGHKDLSLLEPRERKNLNERKLSYFYSGVEMFNKLKHQGLLPPVLHSSCKDPAYDYQPTHLCTTPDGVCVFAGHKTRHYGRRAIICDSHSEKNYLSLDDKTLFGYGDLVDNSIREILFAEEVMKSGDEWDKDNPHHVWDLETSAELCISSCSSMEGIFVTNDSQNMLLGEIFEYATKQGLQGCIEKLNSLERDYDRARAALTDEIIFDKYKRTIASEKYVDNCARWGTGSPQGPWKYIVAILLDYLPLVLIEVVKEYIRPLRVTEDDLRKIQVKRWMKNLSLIPEKVEEKLV